MNKTAIAIATAASLALFTSPLVAEETGVGAMAGEPEDKQSQHQGKSMEHGQHQGTGMDQAGMDADAVIEHYDADGDGKLDEDELSVFGATAAGQDPMRVKGEPLIDHLDEDGDGSVSKEELQKSGVLNGGVPNRESGTLEAETPLD